MPQERLILIGLLILQVVAVILYPPAIFQESPQSAVLPPTLLLLFAAALVGINAGKPEAGRVLLVFVQGVNIVVRLIMLFPNLQNASGGLDIGLILSMLVGMALSWFTITEMEKRPPRFLLLRQQIVE